MRVLRGTELISQSAFERNIQPAWQSLKLLTRRYLNSGQGNTSKVAALAEKGPIEIIQDDTFFNCQNGRLKLCAFSSTEGELIFYRRPDQAGPKESFYLISPTTAPDVLRESLSLGYGQAGHVHKHRTLFLIGRTRIHLDRVENLGHFLELEVILLDGETSETGEAIANDLIGKLGISSNQLIEGAYIDLLNQKGA